MCEYFNAITNTKDQVFKWKTVSLKIAVPCHVSSKFDQVVLIFLDSGYGLKSESSFIEEDPKSNPSPTVESNPKANSDPFATSIGSPELDGKITEDDPPPSVSLEII